MVKFISVLPITIHNKMFWGLNQLIGVALRLVTVCEDRVDTADRLSLEEGHGAAGLGSSIKSRGKNTQYRLLQFSRFVLLVLYAAMNIIIV